MSNIFFQSLCHLPERSNGGVVSPLRALQPVSSAETPSTQLSAGEPVGRSSDVRWAPALWQALCRVRGNRGPKITKRQSLPAEASQSTEAAEGTGHVTHICAKRRLCGRRGKGEAQEGELFPLRGSVGTGARLLPPGQGQARAGTTAVPQGERPALRSLQHSEGGRPRRGQQGESEVITQRAARCSVGNVWDVLEFKCGRRPSRGWSEPAPGQEPSADIGKGERRGGGTGT